MSLFIAFYVYSLPLSKSRACWMVPIKIHAMEGILCDDIISERTKIENLWNILQFNTSWLKYLRTWYIFGFVLASIVLAMTLH